MGGDPVLPAPWAPDSPASSSLSLLQEFRAASLWDSPSGWDTLSDSEFSREASLRLSPSFPSFPFHLEHLIPGALKDPTEDTCFCWPGRIQRVGLSWTSIPQVLPLPLSTLPPAMASELGILTWQLAGSTHCSSLYNFPWIHIGCFVGCKTCSSPWAGENLQQ